MVCVFQWGGFELLDLQGLMCLCCMALTSPVCSLSLFLFVLSPLCTFSHACLTPELHVSDAQWLSPPTCWVFTVILFVICCSSFLSLLSPHPNRLRQMAALPELGLRRRFLPVKTESDRLPLQCKAIIAVVNWHFRNRNELRGKNPLEAFFINVTNVRWRAWVFTGV